MASVNRQQLHYQAYTQAGISAFPALDRVQKLLLGVLDGVEITGSFLDLTARGGIVARWLRQYFPEVDVLAHDASMAARNALTEAGIAQIADITDITRQKSHHNTSLILPAERGNILVRYLLGLAHAATAPDGTLYLVGDKDRGFERYFKEAKALFGAGEILERDQGWRVACLWQTQAAADWPAPTITSFQVETAGRALWVCALPGVFASGKLDLASKLLLSVLPKLGGRRVLDIGCGTGVLGAMAALDGAAVTLLDDDFFSVLATRQTLAANQLPGTVLHSDVDSELGGTDFDVVITNPPFHLSGELILAVAEEFIRAAKRRLRPGGELYLVANHFLPYERLLGQLFGPSTGTGIGTVREIARADGFKVLWARAAS
jgi:16S rRNA (guanine1207-N2)-methyltransferase